MNVIKIVGSIFLVVGLCMLGGAGYGYYSKNTFISSALSALGEIIGMVRKESRSDGTTSYTYAPVVRFTDQNGITQEFVSSTSSNPPSYAKGQNVPIFYAPDNPGNGMIDDFFSRWGLVLILGGMGAVFAGLGGGMLFWLIRKARMKTWLRANGPRLSMDFYSVERDTSLRVNGRSPFRVVAQGKNPFNGKLQQFFSEHIWVDPTEELQGKQLNVFLDPNKPDCHTVDVDKYLDAD